ncbi:hypothetical protein CEXT_422891 [Caerostris extrusa]|uniref:Uncharacterized protein n=1 Tax=Caerostris extrusa TaxID=172846 RepID=A0AAV4MP26_CAEEX|nr:hypothetical protein CEXT_422891 [Caerostris extrusa]
MKILHNTIYFNSNFDTFLDPERPSISTGITTFSGDQSIHSEMKFLPQERQISRDASHLSPVPDSESSSKSQSLVRPRAITVRCSPLISAQD